ncbi:MAG: hypothetical protein ACRCX4_03775 [Bacteroidales bacterium]
MRRGAFIYLFIYLVILAHNVVPHHHAHIFILNSYKIYSGSLQEIHESHASDYEFSIHARHSVKKAEKKVTEPTVFQNFVLAEIHDLFFDNEEKKQNLCYTKSYLRLKNAFRFYAFLRPPPSLQV